MARTRSAESPRPRSKTAAIDEITQGLATFQSILTAIEDFNREGFPYRDGARAKAELQIRETVRRLFGERSPEYQAHCAHKLNISTPADTAQTVHLIKSFVTALEHKKLEVHGLAPTTPGPETGQQPAASGPPPMTLVPPTILAAQMTQTQSTSESTPPVPMSVAITTTLSPPPAPVLPTPAVETPAPVHPPASAISPTYLESARFRTMPADQEPAAPAPVSLPAPAAPATWQAPLASTPTAPTRGTAPSPPRVGIFSSPAASPIPAASLPARESKERIHDQPSAPPLSAVAPPSSPVPSSPSPTPASPSLVPSRDLSTPNPVDALRKVCLRFHAVARQLRLRKDYRATLEVEDDYDLHDLLCALLKLEFDEVGVDEWTPPYADGSTRTTMLLNQDRLAVVAKKTRSGLTTKELADQIAADAARYASHPPCAHLFCFIYDPEGRIGSPTRLETDLTSASDSFTVDVLVAPK